MEIGKKMMEKWGWNKGQGLGKDNKGMTSCLVLRKNDGSCTQGRIEQSAPLVYVGQPVPTAQAQPTATPPIAAGSCPAAGAPAGFVPPVAADPVLNIFRDGIPSKPTLGPLDAGTAAMAVDSNLTGGLSTSSVLAALGLTDIEESANKKRRRSKWDSADEELHDAEAAVGETPTVAQNMDIPLASLGGASGLFSIDPRDVTAGTFAVPGIAAVPSNLGTLTSAPPSTTDPALDAVSQLQAQIIALEQAAAQQAAAQETVAERNKRELKALREKGEDIPPACGIQPPQPNLEKPPQRPPRIRQYVKDDWRWSKGTEALRYFEEVQLVPHLLELARKILGEGSRYPARITDDTDCVTEVTAWGTLLVRPRGTGANIALAKRMLYEVLHPSAQELREEVLITPDEMAEAAVRDQSTISTGSDNFKRIVEGVDRSSHGKLKRVGIGAEDDARAEATSGEVKGPDIEEVQLATAEDAALLRSHLEDLRIASGATPVLNGACLKLLGKDKPVKKAKQLVKRLIETGEWVALTEGFVLSEETKEGRRTNEGPSEQILIKVAEGPATQKIEKHLKAMERAAAADQLKLTTKAVGGKRTLMVEGTRATHERVKLMVREITEKGESPMLSKALGVARAAARGPQVAGKDARNGTVDGGNYSAGIYASSPKLKAAVAPGGDLFSGLPPPTFPSAAAIAGVDDPCEPGFGIGYTEGTTVAFPPLPPESCSLVNKTSKSNKSDSDAEDGLFAGLLPPDPIKLNCSGSHAMPMPIDSGDMTKEAMEAAEKELLELMESVKNSTNNSLVMGDSITE